MLYSCSLHVASGHPSQPSFLFLALSPLNTRTLNVILFSIIQYQINSIPQFVSGVFCLEMKWAHFIPTVFKSPGAQVELSLAFGTPFGSTGNSRSCISQSKTISEWIWQHLLAAILLSPEKQSSPAPCVWQDIPPWCTWKRQPRQDQRPGRGHCWCQKGWDPQLKINISVWREDVGRD